MKKYKLIDGDGYTRRGKNGETFWLDGKEKIATGIRKELCSDDVIHYYDHPVLAVIFNTIHANISEPRLIEIEIDEEVAHDGLKGGCKCAKFVREIPIPVITLEQKVEFAIRVSLHYYTGKKYVDWAENWLNGSDRSIEAAWAAEAAAEAAAERAAWTASAAARAVKSASAAARAVKSAAWAAELAAWAAELAAWAAESAAWAAESAAYMAKSTKEISNFFIKIIETILSKSC